MAWGLKPGEVYVLSGPNPYNLRDFMFELATAMSRVVPRIALFTSHSEHRIEIKSASHGVPSNVTVFGNNAGNDLDFVAGQLRYAKPNVALLEVSLRVLTRKNMTELRRRARRNKVTVFCIVGLTEHEVESAEESAKRAAEYLDAPEDIPEL